MRRTHSDLEDDDDDGEEDESELDISDSIDIEALLDCSSVEYSSYEKESWESSYSREYDRRREEEDDRRENVIEGEESFEAWLADKEEEWDKIDHQKTMDRIKRRKESDAEKPDWPWCIPLRNIMGLITAYALCAEKHYTNVMKYKWSQCKRHRVSGCVDGVTTALSYFIMVILEGQKVPAGYVIDHMPPHNNPLDNRVENLRIITNQQNAQSSRKTKTKTTSQYIGVFKIADDKWASSIQFNGITHYLGMHETEKQAVKARDAWIWRNNQNGDLMFQIIFKDEIEDSLKIPVHVKYKKVCPYLGVYAEPRGKFRASLKKDGVKLVNFRSESDIECAQRYDDTVVKCNLYRPLNFPERHPDFKPERPIITQKRDIPGTTRCEILLTEDASTNPFMDILQYDRIKYYALSFNDDRYVVFKMEGRKKQMLQRFLLNAKPTDPIVDHIDRNRLNYTLENLRFSTRKLNAQNKEKRKGATSNYFGVYKRKNRFIAEINSGIIRYSKTYVDELHAVRAKDLMILTYFPGSHYPMNFKDWTPELEAIWHKKLKIPPKKEIKK